MDLKDPESELRKVFKSEHLKFQKMVEQSNKVFETDLEITARPKTQFIIQLAGDGRVGKNTLVNRYLGKAFEETYEVKEKNSIQ